MHATWAAQLLVDERRRSLAAVGGASRQAVDRRRPCRPVRQRGAARVALGWWMVHAGLRLAVSGGGTPSPQGHRGHG